MIEITLRPTNAFEVFRGVQFRIYQGEASNGIPCEMLGMFRVADPIQRQKLAQEIGQVEVGKQPLITPLIMTPSIIVDDKPQSEDRNARLTMLLRMAREKLRAYRDAQPRPGEYVGGPEYSQLMEKIEELVGK